MECYPRVDGLTISVEIVKRAFYAAAYRALYILKKNQAVFGLTWKRDIKC